jgi:hypothetical protein
VSTETPGAAVIFLHIPKCAGSAFRDVLAANYDIRHAFIVRAPAEDHIALLKRLPEFERASLRLVAGHVPYGIHELLPGPSEYVTFLRDPVDRVVSLYYFIRRDTRHELHAAVRQMSLEEFARGELHPEITNCQTRQLSGREATSFLSGTQPCDAEDLARACRHLETFGVVGLQERYDESVAMCSLRYGWTLPVLREINVTKGRADMAAVPPPVIARIRECNGFDEELYRHAVALFEKQRAACGRRVDRALARQARRAKLQSWTSRLRIDRLLRRLRGPA